MLAYSIEPFTSFSDRTRAGVLVEHHGLNGGKLLSQEFEHLSPLSREQHGKPIVRRLDLRGRQAEPAVPVSEELKCLDGILAVCRHAYSRLIGVMGQRTRRGSIGGYLRSLILNVRLPGVGSPSLRRSSPFGLNRRVTST